MKIYYDTPIRKNYPARNVGYSNNNCQIKEYYTVPFSGLKYKSEGNSFQNIIKNLFAKIQSYIKLNSSKSPEKILKKFKNFSIKEYEKLTKEELEILRTQYELVADIPQNILLNIAYHSTASLRNLESMHETAVLSIKEYLAKAYRQKKYSVVVVGRSLSSIGKRLGYEIGEDKVINIPLSNCYRYSNRNFLQNLKTSGKLAIFKKYLKMKGIDINDKKKYLLMDYCHTGNSLSGARNLFKAVLKHNSAISLNIANCIPDGEYKKKFLRMLQWCEFKEISFVKKCYNIENISKREANIKKFNINHKLLLFKLLDNYMQKSKKS